MRPEENAGAEELGASETEGEEAAVTQSAKEGSVEEPEVVESAKESVDLTPEQEREKLYKQLLMLKAEFENYRKRVDRDRPSLIRLGKEDLLTRLLPLYDMLLDAHKQIAGHSEPVGDEEAADDWDPTVRSLVHGLELIFTEFTKLFKAEKISAIEETGQPYDFNRHEVLGQVETDEFPDGTVIDILQRGYLLDARTLRAAKVRIAKAKPQKTEK